MWVSFRDCGPTFPDFGSMLQEWISEARWGVRTGAGVATTRQGSEWMEGGYHPRCNGKSSEHIVSKRDRRAPLRQRVRKPMKTLSLQGCNRKERTWAILVS